MSALAAGPINDELVLALSRHKSATGDSVRDLDWWEEKWRQQFFSHATFKPVSSGNMWAKSPFVAFVRDHAPEHVYLAMKRVHMYYEDATVSEYYKFLLPDSDQWGKVFLPCALEKRPPTSWMLHGIPGCFDDPVDRLRSFFTILGMANAFYFTSQMPAELVQEGVVFSRILAPFDPNSVTPRAPLLVTPTRLFGGHDGVITEVMLFIRELSQVEEDGAEA